MTTITEQPERPTAPPGRWRLPAPSPRRLLGWLLRKSVEVIRNNSWLAFTVVVSALTAVAAGVTFILPGYFSPSARLTTSKFGYPSLYRKLGKPFPVPATRLTRRALSHVALGEGLVRSEPYIVPIIPMGKVARVLVAEGQRVTRGELIAEVDTTKAQLKVDAAKAALQTAQAELERVKIGSAYVLEKERPERDQIRLEAAEKEAVLRKERIAMDLELSRKGYGSRYDMLNQQIALTALEATIREARFNLRMSSQGVSQSLIIAESAVREAELALAHREAELADYKIYANADGLIERCLVHEGEYNQDPGKPGFLIASAWWFEANFDQGAFGRLKVGDAARVRLEAYPDRFFTGRADWIEPFVSYDLGGPESTRPIRPMGTGAPEWPATFAVRVSLDAGDAAVVPGMTGFCTVTGEGEVDCLPLAAVSALTAGKGIVYVIEGDHYRPQEVALGVIDGDWVEIRSGLTEADRVILDGYQVLNPDDRIEVTSDGGEEG